VSLDIAIMRANFSDSSIRSLRVLPEAETDSGRRSFSGVARRKSRLLLFMPRPVCTLRGHEVSVVKEFYAHFVFYARNFVAEILLRSKARFNIREAGGSLAGERGINARSRDGPTRAWRGRRRDSAPRTGSGSRVAVFPASGSPETPEGRKVAGCQWN